MQIHPDLYLKFSNIEKAQERELERFYSKIKAIEETESTLGAIYTEEVLEKLKEIQEKDIDSIIIETLKKIEKIKYLQDFLTLSKEWPPLSFYMSKVLSISDEYKKDLLKAPAGYISKQTLLDLVLFFLVPFSEIYQREVFKKDINRCKVSIENETSQNAAWCYILMQAKSGVFKKMLPKQIKEEIEKSIRINNPKEESVISYRKIDKYYQSVVKYISQECYVSMEYDRRHGVSEKEIRNYFEKKFPFNENIYKRCLYRNPISKEDLEKFLSYEEFYRTNKCDDDAEYVYGGVFIPKMESK